MKQTELEPDGGAGQALPHVPHDDAVFWTLVSHPVAASPSQFAKPAAQVNLHAPATHEAPVLFGALSGQAFPHAPQFALSV